MSDATDVHAGQEVAVDEPPREEVHGRPVTRSAGQLVLHVDAAGYLDLLRALRDDGFTLLADLTAVDYLATENRVVPDGVERCRFEVVVNLVSLASRERIRVRAQVPGEDPVLPSLFELWPGTAFAEREVFDMFGIRFEGHPDLTRILMPDDWEGHPLRKDYPVGRVPVQFKNPVTQQNPARAR